MNYPPHIQQLYDILGVVFAHTAHSYSPPSVLQVIGWTKNAEKPHAVRRTIICRRVQTTNVDYPGGGQGHIDQNTIVERPVQPVYHHGIQLTLDFSDYPEIGTPVLRKGRTMNSDSQYYTRVDDLERVYHWCEY